MPHNFNKQLEQLRHQFIAGLPQRAHQIEDLWHRLRYVSWSQQGIRTLHSLSHKLAGSGSSFGLPEVSQCAQILDSYLQEHQDLGQPFGGIEREIIDQMVASLVRTLNHSNNPDNASHAITLNRIGDNRHIFVIDDDRALSSLIAAYLEACHFQVHLFTTASESLQQLPLHTPDAIVMDVGFHGEDLQGLAAIEAIKIHLGNTLPIILLSARSDIQARLRALRAGCTHYLHKPVDLSLLANTLSKAINSQETTHKVLIVDDEELVAQYHAEILRHAGMDVMYITNPLQSLQRAIEFKPDLVLLDMHMPEINGIELATLLREEDEFIALPIIFITADTSEYLRHSLESLGVNGVLTKPVNIEQLASTCQRAIDDTTSLKNRIARVTQRANYRHQITRSYFFSAIDNALQQQYVNHQSIAVYYVGLDSVEQLQEKYGQTGIASLHEQFCQIMAQVIGSDEQWTDISNLVVCVLASHSSQDIHHQRTAQIIARLNSCLFEVGDEQFTLSASIGLNYLDTESGSTNSVLRHAEKAYDAARAQGGNCEKEYQSTTDATRQIPEPLVDFNQGLPVDNLCISYQPMISLEQQHIEHYEVLIRWRTDTDELIPAAKFLRYFEHSSMRLELDRWVLQTAVATISKDNHARENTHLFIHLSEETLLQKSFLPFAVNVLRNSRLRGEKRLIFMLEESWIVLHPEPATNIVNTIVDTRCGVCLAHAGISHATEQIIQHLPFDYIKLTPELTSALNSESPENKQLQQIAAAAKNQQAQVIATQVEDARNLSTLWLLGIRLFQGFFIQSPDQLLHTKTDVDFVKQFLTPDDKNEI